MLSDYYAVLNISPQAGPTEIKAAYRGLARNCHPDVCFEPNAEERFKRINEAYAVLRDPATRAKYDQRFALRYPAAPRNTSFEYNLYRYRTVNRIFRNYINAHRVDDVLANIFDFGVSVAWMEYNLFSQVNPFKYFFRL